MAEQVGQADRRDDRFPRRLRLRERAMVCEEPRYGNVALRDAQRAGFEKRRRDRFDHRAATASSCASESSAAEIVRSISRVVCAVETNSASNCEGGR